MLVLVPTVLLIKFLIVTSVCWNSIETHS